MRSVRSRVAAAAALVLLPAISLADAPPDQYATYTPSATEIYDNFARLDWIRIVSDPMVDHGTAVQLCAGNNKRLPTYRELLTLVDEDPHLEWDPEAGASTNRYIDPNAFPGTPAGPFWSMSPGANPGTFKVVDFTNGESKDSVATTAWVRCVGDVVP